MRATASAAPLRKRRHLTHERAMHLIEITWNGLHCEAIPGYHKYFACEDGRIISCWRCRGDGLYGEPFPLSPALQKNGRNQYALRRSDGRFHSRWGASLVLEAFVGPRPPGCEACHNDGNRANDAAYNLRWDTPSGNQADKLLHGTVQFGESHPNCKLSDADVEAVLRLHSLGLRRREIAARFPAVSYGRICELIRKNGRGAA